ncbi:P-loop NTPase family protein [Evansella halocellulosilytica]|uniref:DNA topology modulation protein FlaR n=1 Tax=Evansella halocellulosilytica TaxID=2011013 RepID=UPI000BB93A3E|nr:DNA topology modulation protein FlaR [Evansella halocellulosilytica]
MNKKIHIVGSVGSGKTTLAKSLSHEFNIPYYELDNVVWRRSELGDIRNPPEKWEESLRNIVSTDKWIVEGVHNEQWVRPSLKEADVILFLNLPHRTRRIRIVSRFIKQKFGLEPSHYKPTWTMFFKMFKWDKQFELKGKPRILDGMSDCKGKLVILHSRKDVTKYMDALKKE